MAMFLAFQRRDLPLYHLHFGTIILLPKKENVIQIQQYRPICLLNVSFKFFTKVGTVGVLDTGVSRSTCSWATSTAQLWPRSVVKTEA
jgi:hypothetical protein